MLNSTTQIVNFSNEEIRKWMENNLVLAKDALKITGQSRSAFNQSVSTGQVKPFIQFGEQRVINLYLKSELEVYRKKKKK